jgi:hypothetical protein
MTTKSFVIRPSFLVMSAGALLFSAGDRCLSQDAEQKENEVRQIQILLGVEGLDVVSPALKGEEPVPTETPMLPPGTESISELHSPGHPGIERRNLESRHVQNAQKSNLDTEYFREQISQQIDFLARQGNDVQQLRELVERLQLALENYEKRTTRDVEVAVFAVPEAAQESPEGTQRRGSPRAGISFTGSPPAGPPGFGPPGFGPPALRMGGRAEMHPGQKPQIQHPEAHTPEGLFAEDRKRIASLTESAERIAQAGLPDVAHGLRERAEQLERELAEKQARVQHEERQRTESAMRERQEQARQQPQRQQPRRLMEQRLMGQRREGIEIELAGHPTPQSRELHEQMEQLRRDMHKLSEQMTDLTRLIQQHHNPRNDRGRHDEDGDDEGEMDEDDEDHKKRGEHEEE